MTRFVDLVQQELAWIGQRIRGMAMISRGLVPDLLVSQRVVDHVARAAQRYLEDETGETMVGFMMAAAGEDAMPTLVVLDTIAPDDSTIRETYMFEQGDEIQGDIFVWLLENWNVYQDLGRDLDHKPIRSEWRVPLLHLGDWHKQPGFMIMPSGGDLMTALRFMEDDENDFEFLLVPIVTLGHDPVTTSDGAAVNYFTVSMPDGSHLRMDWWYIHRAVRVFQPIQPRIVPAKELPTLAPYPWHILNRELLEDEMNLLADDGWFLIGETSILWEVDGELPLEICFIVGQRGSQQVYLIVTDWDYPRRAPRARVASFEGVDLGMYIYEIFAHLWKQSKPAEVPADFHWTDESFLVDFLAALTQRPRPARRAAAAAAPVVVPAVEAEAPEVGEDDEEEDE